jgi:hypothetical protein
MDPPCLKGCNDLKRYGQFLQAALACGIMVILIFSIPMLMAATPVRLDISFMRPGNFLTEHQNTNSPAAAHEF